MEAAETNGGTQFRLAENERDLRDLNLYVRGVPERVKANEEAIREIKGSINKLIWSVLGFTFTVAASAIAVLVALGQ